MKERHKWVSSTTISIEFLRTRFNQSLTVKQSRVPRAFRAKRLEFRQFSFNHATLWSCALCYTLISNTCAFPSCYVPLNLSVLGKTDGQLDFSLIQYRFRRCQCVLTDARQRSLCLHQLHSGNWLHLQSSYT